MGVRFRKSTNVGPFRFTFSKSGVSTSFGGKGARITKTASGKTRTTLSIPGTGLSYVSETGGKKRTAKKRAAPAAPLDTAPATSATSAPAPLSAGFVRTMGIILALFGAMLCALFLPLGIVAMVAGIYFSVKARAIADRHNEKDRLAAVEEADCDGQ
jgi:hypothetical protein